MVKPFGLPRTDRVLKSTEFAKMRKTAQKWVCRHWILFYSKSDHTFPRLAVTISRKYGNSVARNAYRRWMRETFRLNKAQLPACDLHFLARQKPTNLSKTRYKEELNEDFEKLLHRFR